MDKHIFLGVIPVRQHKIEIQMSSAQWVSPVLKCSCLAVDQNSKPSRQVASSISTTLQPALNCSLISLLLKGKILSGSLRKI